MIGSQMNGQRNDGNFDGYLIFDFHEFQGLISQPEQNPNDERTLSESKTQSQQMLLPLTQARGRVNSNLNGGGVLNTSSNVLKLASNQDNLQRLSIDNQVIEDCEDDKKSPTLHIQGLDYLDKTKDKTNYDEFYMFLMGLDFLGINNTRNRVDPILMNQFNSLVQIKEYFVMLKNHIDKITEDDSDLWFDELKNTFKLMLHQFENMINSISEQINPVSLSVCFFRCIEQIKVFEQFLHLRSFHVNNAKTDNSAVYKFRRSLQLCILWKKLTGNKTYDKLISHLESDSFNCQACEKCKRESRINLQIFSTRQTEIGLQNLQEQSMSRLNQNFRPIKGAYFNTKIFLDIQENFAKLIEKDLDKINSYKQKKSSGDVVLFNLADRTKNFRILATPICKSFDETNIFYV